MLHCKLAGPFAALVPDALVDTGTGAFPAFGCAPCVLLHMLAWLCAVGLFGSCAKTFLECAALVQATVSRVDVLFFHMHYFYHMVLLEVLFIPQPLLKEGTDVI